MIARQNCLWTRRLSIRVEPQLVALLPQHNSSELFRLIARGKSLFTQEPVDTSLSFGELIDLCAEKKLLPEPLLSELHSLRDDYFPPSAVGALKLKSIVYRFITSVLHGQPDLKADALEALYKAKPDFLRSIPGFRPPPEPKNRGTIAFLMTPDGPTIERNSLLTRLIDQTTFQRFRFVSMAPSRA